MKRTVLLAVAGWCCGQVVCGQPIGYWAMSDKALPVYHYTGPLPFTAVDQLGSMPTCPKTRIFCWATIGWLSVPTPAAGISF